MKKTARETVLAEALENGPLSLGRVRRCVAAQDNPGTACSDAHTATLELLRALSNDGLIELGELSGPDGRFAAWDTPIDEAISELAMRFPPDYDDHQDWGTAFWLNLTAVGRDVARTTRPYADGPPATTIDTAGRAYQDWAPYSGLEEAAAAYLRDPAIAMDALRRVINPSAVQAFTMERTLAPEDGADESLYQEIAITDGRVLVLWMGNDVAGGDDAEPGATLLRSTVRSFPLSAIVDRTLEVNYRVDVTGGRSLHSVELRLFTAKLDHTVAETPSRTEAYCDELRFTKSVTDGGRAQMERLAQFGRVISARA
jgi:hypothetical protein